MSDIPRIPRALSPNCRRKTLKLKHKIATAWACLPLFVSMLSTTTADTWTCHQGDLTRHVLAFYPEAPARLPCQVFYSKPKENVMPRALWKASHDVSFCERKAAEFAGQLRSWGWHCSNEGTVQGQDKGLENTLLPPTD